MPLYDFVCDNCDTQFEMILASYSTREVQVCPHCMSSETKIQFPTPHLVKSGVIGARSKIPKDFQQGVLDPMKKVYRKVNPDIDNTIKT